MRVVINPTGSRNSSEQQQFKILKNGWIIHFIQQNNNNTNFKESSTRVTLRKVKCIVGVTVTRKTLDGQVHGTENSTSKKDN